MALVAGAGLWCRRPAHCWALGTKRTARCLVAYRRDSGSTMTPARSSASLPIPPTTCDSTTGGCCSAGRDCADLLGPDSVAARPIPVRGRHNREVGTIGDLGEPALSHITDVGPAALPARPSNPYYIDQVVESGEVGRVARHQWSAFANATAAMSKSASRGRGLRPCARTAAIDAAVGARSLVSSGSGSRRLRRAAIDPVAAPVRPRHWSQQGLRPVRPSSRRTPRLASATPRLGCGPSRSRPMCPAAPARAGQPRGANS